MICDDEQERRSQLKVMKEFERTLNFANNMTKIGFQCDSNSIYQLKHSMDAAVSFDVKQFCKPEISLETLYYDEQTKWMNKEGLYDTIKTNDNQDAKSSPEELETLNKTSSFKHNHHNSEINLTINAEEENQTKKNIMQFHVIKENEKSKFKDELAFSNKLKTECFEVPTQLNELNRINVTKKKSKESSINSYITTKIICPQESTPIFNCELTANARRKFLMNKLDLNSTFMDKEKNSTNIIDNVVINKYDDKMSIISTVLNEANPNNSIKLCSNNDKLNCKQSTMHNKPLNISQYAALNNASATCSFVVISKTDVPKDLKKTLKEEIKREKKNCIIQ